MALAATGVLSSWAVRAPSYRRSDSGVTGIGYGTNANAETNAETETGGAGDSGSMGSCTGRAPRERHGVEGNSMGIARV